MTGPFVNPSWMPHSVGEAAKAGDATADDLGFGPRVVAPARRAAARRPTSCARTTSARNAADLAAGFRHLLVLLSLGADQALRAEPDPVLAVNPSGVDNVYKWGMDCPDCIYTGAPLRGGETYRIWGNRGTRPLRRAAVDGRHGVLGQRPARRARPRAGRRGRADRSRPSATRATGCPSPRTPPCWSSATSSMTGTPRWRRRCRSSGWVGGGGNVLVVAAEGRRRAGRSPGGGGAPARSRWATSCVGQPGVLPPVLPARDAEHLPAAARRHRHGRSGREPPRHRLVPARAGRGAGGGGHPAPGPVLELLAREPVVGDRSTTPATRAA